MRAYYLASALGAWRADRTRLTISARQRSAEEAITFSIATLKPTQIGSGPPWTSRQEPNWLDPANVSKLLHELGCANESGFQAAISLGTTVHQDLITYRNFAAHRNRKSAEKVRSLAVRHRIPSHFDPIELPLQLLPQRSYTLLASWLYDLTTVISFVPR
jgi:hypothetical protein